MNEETLYRLIDILVLRCRWIERDSLSRVLETCEIKPSEIASIFRYGMRSKLVVSHAVNCNPAVPSLPIYKQINDSRPTSNELAEQLSSDSVTPFQPTTFIAGSRLVAGLFGVEVVIPKSTLEWHAHLRMGRALVHHVVDQSVPISQWQLRSDEWRAKDALWASIRETTICVPIVNDRDSLETLTERLSWSGETYEFW